MKIVNINSGLGNQMFQYAFYLSLKNMNKNQKVKVDITWFDNEKFHNGFELSKVFGVSPDFATYPEVKALSHVGYSFLSRVKRRLCLRKDEIVEPKILQFKYSPSLFGQTDVDNFYRGYWQSYKYFDSVEHEVLREFSFPIFSDRNNLEMEEFLKENIGRTVSIHVRLGDYLKDKRLSGLCSLEYYTEAISKVRERVEDPIFIVFSDDIDWCKSNLDSIGAKFVDWNISKNSFRDMQLMSLCSNNIIANSSFSWWGAFLNKNESKLVIAPKVWMRDVNTDDLIPDSWVRL
ncbi:alpha-1,2-fucosyltransferase [Vibrio ostreicida]|uniref:Alpha-1,2-fucosyltransferase n=1 Tax=Vibrio ostreicida TaxID=526588 RepID=A0ABT8BMW0_9VIBR|nr:alpha-1,2-fucosyltransferase [Vibrio ostreicida]MDN3608477.1 alpha-1,2-fucosyltransferase [Vibrio ostreicida]NPD10299.1 alpha-1,2-fucosyltransferase [Vibrio ostreicida]